MSIKRLDPNAIFKVISSSDDALLNETPEELISDQLDADGNRVMNTTRYEQYTEEMNLDESKLKFVEGKVPDRFILRPLTADETADLNSKYILFSSESKKMTIINKNRLFLEMFRAAYQGIETNGVITQVPTKEIQFQIQIEMGATVSILTNLGKNLKK